jgi:oligopeptide/dipeptide ABC transporter ATP-binding protein
LVAIPGQPPSLINPPRGCPFHPRCAFTMERCLAQAPPLHPVEGGGVGHLSACFLGSRLVGPASNADRRAYATDHR